MYTVLIVSSTTSRLMNDYRFLFDPFIQSGQLDICNWNEAGTELDSSVPELCDLVKGKKKWRAIVAVTPQFESDDETAQMPFDEFNPFDFDCNSELSNVITESAVPLVRLTHMLAGYPRLGVKSFKEVIIDPDPEHGDRIVYVNESGEPIDSSMLHGEDGKEYMISYVSEDYTPEEKETYYKLVQRYDFPDNRPEELILVSTRRIIDATERSSPLDCWEINSEANASNFCKRNNYPDMCRFMAYDIPAETNTLFKRHIFEFWLSLLTVASNHIPPSSLQAYRLYKVGVDISASEFTEIMTDHISKMHSAQESIISRISKVDRTTINPDARDFVGRRIPVIFDKTQANTITVHTDNLGLYRDSPEDEMSWWRKNVIIVMNDLERYVKMPRRIISASASTVHDIAEVYRINDYHMDQYQIDDVQEKADELEHKIFSGFDHIAIDHKQNKAELGKEITAVKKSIAVRMRKKIALSFGGVALAVYLAGFIPYIINSAKNGTSLGLKSFLLVLAACAVVGAAGFLALFILSSKLRKKIESFNLHLRDIVASINESETKYEDHLSNMCTFMKAQAMLMSARKLIRFNSAPLKKLKAHRLALRSSIARCTDICSSYGINPIIEPMACSSVFFDSEIVPQFNPIYRISPNNTANNIPMGSTGSNITAPYKFVVKLLLERENLYEK